MIITQTPFRMSFFGGGTDMESFFRENGGAVLSTTFDKYCYVNVRHLPRFFDYSTELSYSKTERVTCIEDIQHPAIRNAMKMLDIVLLEDMKDGILYSNILLKLYLKSLKNGGKLQLDEHIPYTAQMIATLTRHQIGTVERALEIFRQLGLVEQLDSGAFYMTDIELMIGQSSTEAERKRAARLENKALLPSRTKGGHLSDIRPPEIEIELEKEIKIEKEREGETGHPAPAAYGRYNNVILTDTELSGLKTELPDKWEYYIDRLSCHIASTGKQYHSHAATIYKWAQEDAAKGKAAPKQGIPDYSCKEGESL